MANTKDSLTIDVVSLEGKKVEGLALNGEIFSIAPHAQTMFDAVVIARHNMRQSNAKSKSRSEVAGSGMKPWKQKGTGRARAGAKRSPVWVGGGVTFGPTGRENHSRSQNKKQYRLALRSALSEKFLENKLVVVDALTLATPKTKDALKVLTALNVTGKVLFVFDAFDENFALSLRNLANTLTVSRQNLSVIDVLEADYLVMSKASVTAIEEALQ
jgi:large subunit ribosomal protein L4